MKEEYAAKEMEKMKDGTLHREEVKLSRSQAGLIVKDACKSSTEWSICGCDITCVKLYIEGTDGKRTWSFSLDLDFEKPYPKNEGSLQLLNHVTAEGKVLFYEHAPLSLDTQAAKIFLRSFILSTVK